MLPFARRSFVLVAASSTVLMALACSSSEPAAPASTSPDGDARSDAAVSATPSPPSTPSSDAGADSGPATPTCKKEYDTLGMPCLKANNTVCPTGDGACYSISLRTVCGPKDRGCSLDSPTCAGAGQKCRAPLRTGTSEGICLTDDEAVCFCGNIGVTLRPPFCPIADEERPGIGGTCSCPNAAEYCVSEPVKGPCKPELTCIRGACRGKACTDESDCAANEVCISYATSGGQILGKACGTKL